MSKNDLGHEGAVAVGNLLENDNELLYLDLSGKIVISFRLRQDICIAPFVSNKAFTVH